MYRQIRRVRQSGRSKPDAVAVFLYEGVESVPETCEALERRLEGAITKALGRREVSTARGRVSTLYPSAGADRLLICGVGKASAFDGNALRLAAARLLRAAEAAGVQHLEICPAALTDRLAPEAVGAAIGDGFAIARFDFNAFKGAVGQADDKTRTKATGLRVTLDDDLAAGFDRALAIGQGQRTTRDLAATPPNVANPAHIVAHCRKLARAVGLRCTVIDAKKAEKMGMGGISAVGRAGSTPPALIALEWPGRSRASGRGKKSSSKKPSSPRMPAHPVLLVGKAVTFDTGGYSLKVGGSMQGMKYDKCGGMTVIGAMEAVARLKLDLPVVGLIPAVENMIDEQAYRVDDIITLYNGVTVEVTNTDAEGRLILADALAYGTEHYQPRAVLDFATLTGGVVVALGSYCAGLWCNDDELNRRLDAASQAAGERLWRMPLWDEHRDQMKSTHADLANSADREAHPIQGAAFLSYFVGDKAATEMPTLPWAHVDIAGVAAVKGESDKSGLYGKGPTGFGVRMLAELLRTW